MCYFETCNFSHYNFVSLSLCNTTLYRYFFHVNVGLYILYIILLSGGVQCLDRPIDFSCEMFIFPSKHPTLLFTSPSSRKATMLTLGWKSTFHSLIFIQLTSKCYNGIRNSNNALPLPIINIIYICFQNNCNLFSFINVFKE